MAVSRGGSAWNTRYTASSRRAASSSVIGFSLQPELQCAVLVIADCRAHQRTSRRKPFQPKDDAKGDRQHEDGSKRQPSGNPHRTTRRNPLRFSLQACAQLEHERRLRAKGRRLEKCILQPGAQGTPRLDVGPACEASFEVVIHRVVRLGAQFARHERVGQLTNIRAFHVLSGSRPLQVSRFRDCAEVGTKKGPSPVET